ncbi:hypothetical protein LX36DRAFT_294272 [Colletotrichum falcatum]|nr:hypothetical protein LX36DRAFT_294272 [Colletotrichum falcatum]
MCSQSLFLAHAESTCVGQSHRPQRSFRERLRVHRLAFHCQPGNSGVVVFAEHLRGPALIARPHHFVPGLRESVRSVPQARRGSACDQRSYTAPTPANPHVSGVGPVHCCLRPWVTCMVDWILLGHLGVITRQSAAYTVVLTHVQHAAGRNAVPSA